MKPNRSVRLAVALLILLTCSTAFAFQGPQPFSADMATTASHGNLNMTGKVYFSLPNMRIDMNSASEGKQAGPFGGKMSMIMDAPAKKMYMLMTEQHMYMEFSTENPGPMGQKMPNFQEMMKSGDMCAGHEGATCKKVGTESINGRPCDKWEMTEKNATTSTFWIDQKLHFPIKVVNGDITTQYTNIKEGPQDPALFKIPAGYQKMDMGGMGRPPR